MPHRLRGTIGAIVVVLALASCAAPVAPARPSGDGALRDAGCPDVIRIAADGAEPEHIDYLQQLVGEQGGVEIALLTGGDQPPAERLHDDLSIFLGVVDARDAIRASGTHPVVGVLAPVDAPDYPGMIALVPQNVVDYPACLAVLVPLLQDAAASPAAGDGAVDPDRLDALIAEVTAEAADDRTARVAPDLGSDDLFSAEFLAPGA